MPRRRLTLVTSAVALNAVGLCLAATASGAFPGENGRIALGLTFEDRCEWPEIASMRPDGSGLRSLSRCADPGSPGWTSAASPDFSADGRRILYLDGGRPAVMARDGSRRRVIPLAERQGFVSIKPSFAPDGKHFAYGRPTRRPLDMSALAEIWRAGINGKEDRRIGFGYLPRWSPDGRTIAYIGRVGVTLIDAGSGRWLRNLTSDRRGGALDWSPDGRRLLWAPYCCDASAYVIRRDGKRVRRIRTALSTPLEEAVWSPDGRRIAFSRHRTRGDDSELSVWTMRADGSGLRRRLTSGWFDSFDDLVYAPQLTWGVR